VKHAANETAAEHKAAHEDKAHDVRESIVSTAQNVKEHVQDAIHGNRTNDQ
jgi:hydroxymethylglutaryl-CoA reductase